MSDLLVPRWTVRKFDLDGALRETVEIEQNMLMFGGASILWELLLGRAPTPYDADNAYIGVGDSADVADPHQADLLGENVRRGMEPEYPIHVTSNSATTISVTFRAFFANGVAEFEWQELALFNGATGGRMFNRRVSNIGEKLAGSNWMVDLSFELKPVPEST